MQDGFQSIIRVEAKSKLHMGLLADDQAWLSAIFLARAWTSFDMKPVPGKTLQPKAPDSTDRIR